MGRIVVAGAIGQAGQPLCRRLIEMGHEVVVLTRRPEQAPETVPGAADYLHWEPSGARRLGY